MAAGESTLTSVFTIILYAGVIGGREDYRGDTSVSDVTAVMTLCCATLSQLIHMVTHSPLSYLFITLEYHLHQFDLFLLLVGIDLTSHTALGISTPSSWNPNKV